MTLVEYLRALHEAPGTCPPVPPDQDLQQLQDNKWIAPDGDGWRITEDARTLLRFTKNKPAA